MCISMYLDVLQFRTIDLLHKPWWWIWLQIFFLHFKLFCRPLSRGKLRLSTNKVHCYWRFSFRAQSIRVFYTVGPKDLTFQGNRGKLPLTLPLAWFHNIELKTVSKKFRIKDSRLWSPFSRFQYLCNRSQLNIMSFSSKENRKYYSCDRCHVCWIKANTYPVMQCKISAPKSMLKSDFQRMPWHFDNTAISPREFCFSIYN